MTEQTEQWKLDGNCKECRRKNYCKKYCSKRKRRINYEVHNAISRALAKRIMTNTNED